MDDISRPLPRDSAAQLVATVPRPDFGQALLAHISRAASIANFGAFHVADMARPDPVLSVWSGEMSDYWFTRNARKILSDTGLRDDITARIAAAPAGGLGIERWQPPATDPRAPIYRRDGVIERVTVSSRTGRGGFLSFYLRGAGAGWITDAEFACLKGILPLAHELIGLRHRIIGATPQHFAPTASASALRDRGVGPFTALSPREAATCDLIVKGLGVAGSALELGVSENTIRTLRRRAYRKLSIASAAQLVALVLSDTG